MLASNGTTAATATTTSNGSFTFSNVGSGNFRIQIAASNFSPGFAEGIFFLGTQSLTPTNNLSPTLQAILSLPIVDIAMIIAYLWIWAGFAMVVIGAGLAALNREVIEAAQIDGACEWQTLRRVTVPMLRPVLVVVFVTMLINVLKIFDIILNMASPSSQGGASTLALGIFSNFEAPRDRVSQQRSLWCSSCWSSPPCCSTSRGSADDLSAVSVPVAPGERHHVAVYDHRASSSTSCSPSSPSSGWYRPSASRSFPSGQRARSRSPGGGLSSLRPRSSRYELPDLFSAGFKAGGVLDSLTTSIAITVPVTILVTLISALTAYSLVFGRWRGRTVVFLLIVAMLVLPLQMALIPVASLYKVIGTATGLKLFGSVIGVIVFHVAFGLPFGIFLMRNFYTGTRSTCSKPGASTVPVKWKLFRKVVLPIGLPALASLAIFQFIWVWNDLLVALIFLSGNTHQTLTLFLYGQNARYRRTTGSSPRAR